MSGMSVGEEDEGGARLDTGWWSREEGKRGMNQKGVM